MAKRKQHEPAEQLVVDDLKTAPFDITQAMKVAPNVWEHEGRRYTIRFFDTESRKFVSYDRMLNKTQYTPKPAGGKLIRKKAKMKMPQSIKDIVIASLEKCGGIDFVASSMKRYPKQALQLLGKMQAKEVNVQGNINHNLSMVDVIRRERMLKDSGNRRILTQEEADIIDVNNLDVISEES